MRPITAETMESAEWSIARAISRLERAQRAVETGSRLGVADRRLLWLLSDGQARTLREVAEQLGLEQSTVNRQVNAALEAGLLQRSREPQSPSYLLQVTDRGVASFKDEVDRHLGLFGAGLEALPHGAHRQFVEHLLAFADSYGAAAEQETP